MALSSEENNKDIETISCPDIGVQFPVKGLGPRYRDINKEGS
jgi:hypothetical protein